MPDKEIIGFSFIQNIARERLTTDVEILGSIDDKIMHFRIL